MSQRAKHPKDRLYELHGSLLDIKCSNEACDYIDKENLTEPICSALAADLEETNAFTRTPAAPSKSSKGTDLANNLSAVKIEEEGPKHNKHKSNALEAILESLSPTITPEMRQITIPSSDLPHCPKCSSILRPGVVWFGEPLSKSMFDEINAWIEEEKKLDLMLVIGTTAEVYPAARFLQIARERGARIAYVNLNADHTGAMNLGKRDWVFAGDVEEVLEVLFEGVLLND